MSSVIKNHFRHNDPLLYSLVKIHGIIPLKKSNDYFTFLCESIASQQLSIKASDTIFGRFTGLFPGKKVNPRLVLKFTNDDLRNVGFSYTKVSYIKDLAQKVVEKNIQLDLISDLPDAEVVKVLTTVKGIGVWTAEMFLMSALGREDVFSYGDLGLRKAIQKLYNLEELSKTQAEKITIKWSPYRTYASKILWQSLTP